MIAREFRLREDRDVKRTLRLGRRFQSPECSLYTTHNKQEDSRMTVVVSSGVSKYAVDRNRIKRQAREVMEAAMEASRSPEPFDAVLVMRPPVADIADSERYYFLKEFFQRARSHGII